MWFFVPWALLFAACEGDDGPDTQVDPDADRDGYIADIDCDDADPHVHPEADEVCNGIDDDCDQSIDNDALDAHVGFVDGDGDGSGTALPIVTCADVGWAATSGDCDDTDPSRFPGASDVCNAVDDDCDLAVDEGVAIEGVVHDGLADAVLAATAGDVVVLCDGVIGAGGIVIDRPLTITSVSGDPALTTIDGTDALASVFVVDGGDLTLDGVTVTGGTGSLATHTIGQPAALAGGAINALRGAGGPVTVRNCVFDENSAHLGGAIAGRTFTIEDSTFTRNFATGAAPREGGAVWVAEGGIATIERTSFVDNQATDGGAIASRSPTTLVDVDASGNAAASRGGVAHLRSLSGQPRATLAITGGELHENTAADRGGAVHLLDASGRADVTALLRANSANEGGAVAITAMLEDGPVVTWGGGTYTDNFAATSGGAVLLDAVLASIAVADLVVTGNTAEGNGGGLALRGTASGSCAVRDSVVSDNQSFLGGGVSILNSASTPMVFERVDIVGNTAGGPGGGLYVLFADVDFTDVAIVDNTAQSGGAFWLGVIAAVDATGSDVAGNHPQDVWFGGFAMGTDLPDSDATFKCVGADAICF